MEIKLPGDQKEIPKKLETFTSIISSLTSQVVELKTIQWELPPEFLILPNQISLVQEKLKTLDALPSLLNKVTITRVSYFQGRLVVSIIARVAVAAMTYFLWMERNSRLFTKKILSVDKLVQSICSFLLRFAYRLGYVVDFKKTSPTSRKLLDMWKVPKQCIVHNGSVGFASLINPSSLQAKDKGIPLAGKSNASPAKGEKNTYSAIKEANLKNNLVDLMGINVVEEYHKKKLLYDKYYDKMLKRRKIPKIINCDVLTKKCPITLKVYREDGTDGVISNFKVSDLHLAE
ncbi:hypothetical protein Tco_0531392 [Tanacetum coccineum]